MTQHGGGIQVKTSKRTSVRFNTEEKMMKCYEELIRDVCRMAMTFHIVEPVEDKDYLVIYNVEVKYDL